MRGVLATEEAAFQKYCERFPPEKVTDRGEPFWYKHPAKDLLEEDVKSGLAFQLKPELLRAHRKEYQAFTLRTFRKHVQQEKEKQRADPYWRYKRNIKAMMQLVKERGLMKQSWMETQLEAEVDGATSALAQIGRLV
jgi:hypothetical protein